MSIRQIIFVEQLLQCSETQSKANADADTYQFMASPILLHIIDTQYKSMYEVQNNRCDMSNMLHYYSFVSQYCYLKPYKPHGGSVLNILLKKKNTFQIHNRFQRYKKEHHCN